MNSISSNQSLLVDPQNLNGYSYTKRNPINYWDPTGLLTVVIPGTFYNSKSWTDDSPFVQSVGKTFGETPVVISNKNIWSGKDYHADRIDGAGNISEMINAWSFKEGEKLNIVAHSHGGGVAKLITNSVNRKVNNLVTLGTPNLQEYKVDSSNVEQYTQVYSDKDLTQMLAGRQTSMSAVLGGYLFGINGFMFGGKAGINEMGPAKRTDSNANNTINATSKTSWNPNPATAHGELWQNQSIWADVDTIIKK